MGEINGKFKTLGEYADGESTRGKWAKQIFVVTTEGKYPKDVSFEAWNEKTSEVKAYTVGQDLKVSYNLESREYNGKWYLTAKAWKIGVNGTPPPKNQQSEDPEDMPF